MSRKKKPQPSPEYRPFNENAADERREREHKMLASVGFKKVKIEDDLERQADKLLAEQDHDLLLRLIESTEAIRAGMESIKLPSNDPHYLQTLQACKDQRDKIANVVAEVVICHDGPRTWIGVGVTNVHNRPMAIEAARDMAEHFEAKLTVKEDQ